MYDGDVAGKLTGRSEKLNGVILQNDGIDVMIGLGCLCCDNMKIIFFLQDLFKAVFCWWCHIAMTRLLSWNVGYVWVVLHCPTDVFISTIGINGIQQQLTYRTVQLTIFGTGIVAFLCVKAKLPDDLFVVC